MALIGSEATELFRHYMQLLEADCDDNGLHEITSTPIVTMSVIKYGRDLSSR